MNVGIVGSRDINVLPSGINNDSEAYLIQLENGDYVFASNYYTLSQSWFGDGKGQAIIIDGQAQKIAGKIEITEVAERKIRAEIQKMSPEQKQVYLRTLYTRGIKINAKDEIGSYEEQIARLEAIPPANAVAPARGYRGRTTLTPASRPPGNCRPINRPFASMDEFESLSGCRVSRIFTADEAVTYLTREAGISRETAFKLFNAILGNPSFTPDKLDEEFMEELGSLVASVRHNTFEHSADAFEFLAAVLRSPENEMDTFGLRRILCATLDFFRQRPEVLVVAKQLVMRFPKETKKALEALDDILRADELHNGLFTAFGDSVGAISDFSDSDINFFLYTLPDLIANEGPGILDRYHEGEELAKKCVGAYNDPVVWLNFSYAITVLGRERTLALHRATGMIYFARYSRKTLEEVSANLDPNYRPGRPPFLVYVNRATVKPARYGTSYLHTTDSDGNGSFYRIDDTFEPLFTYYRVVVIESDKDVPDLEKVKALAEGFGNIHGITIGAHGNPDGIQMGSTHSEEHHITRADMAKWETLKPYFVDSPLIIFKSCSTARTENAIAGDFSRMWSQGETYGPIIDSGSLYFILDEIGKIIDVKYNVSRRKLIAGRTENVMPPPPSL